MSCTRRRLSGEPQANFICRCFELVTFLGCMSFYTEINISLSKENNSITKTQSIPACFLQARSASLNIRGASGGQNNNTFCLQCLQYDIRLRLESGLGRALFSIPRDPRTFLGSVLIQEKEGEITCCLRRRVDNAILIMM
jgi:hypothetical protein